jgi:hypothetical protein
MQAAMNLMRRPKRGLQRRKTRRAVPDADTGGSHWSGSSGMCPTAVR